MGATSLESDKALKNHSFLIADDTPVLRSLLKKVVERLGHSADVAADGAEALAKVISNDYDIILMDMQMPVMDGLQATRKIRALSCKKAKVPIIGITADSLVGYEVFLDAGVNSLLRKPVAFDDLILEIRRLVNSEPVKVSPARETHTTSETA